VLAACAATLAALPAHAQNVTLSGFVNAALIKMNNGASHFGGGAGKLNAKSMGGDDSMVALSGTEDMGGGLKARFLLEHRFNSDDGTVRTAGTITRGFWWTSYVGIVTPYGSIDLGRQSMPLTKATIFADPTQWLGVAQINALLWPNGYAANDILKANNAVTYTTPNFGGVQAQFQVAANEGPLPGRQTGWRVDYHKGPIYAALAYDSRKPSDNVRDHVTLATGWYDFGFIKPILTYSKATVNNQPSANAYAVGAVVPFGPSSIHATWIVGHPARAGFTGGLEDKKLALQYRYNLSKRTLLFTSYATAKQDGFSRTTGYDFGIRHYY